MGQSIRRGVFFFARDPKIADILAATPANNPRTICFPPQNPRNRGQTSAKGLDTTESEIRQEDIPHRKLDWRSTKVKSASENGRAGNVRQEDISRGSIRQEDAASPAPETKISRSNAKTSDRRAVSTKKRWVLICPRFLNDAPPREWICLCGSFRPRSGGRSSGGPEEND